MMGRTAEAASRDIWLGVPARTEARSDMAPALLGVSVRRNWQAEEGPLDSHLDWAVLRVLMRVRVAEREDS